MTDILAYDLGGSSLRLALLTKAHDITHMVRMPVSIPRGGEGRYEIDPAIWWDKFCQACVELKDRGADLSKVRAIAGCGFTRTQVPMTRQGRNPFPAITFQDSRGIRALQGFLDQAADDLAQRAPNLSPFHPIARMLWLKKTCLTSGQKLM